MGVACRIVRRRIACRTIRRRIACRTIRRRIASRHVSAHVGDLGVPAVSTVRCAEHPSSAMPRPNSACSRRRHRRFTNIYSFTCLSHSIMSPSAARLRRGVGPLASRKAVAGQTGSSDIVGNNRPSFGHFRAFPGISGYVRIYPDTRWSSRAVSSVAGHAVLYGLSLRYRSSPGTAWGKGHRVPYHLSPDTA